MVLVSTAQKNMWQDVKRSASRTDRNEFLIVHLQNRFKCCCCFLEVVDSTGPVMAFCTSGLKGSLKAVLDSGGF